VSRRHGNLALVQDTGSVDFRVMGDGPISELPAERGGVFGVVFLGIDGVLVGEGFAAVVGGPGKIGPLFKDSRLDPWRLAILSKICEGGRRVVIADRRWRDMDTFTVEAMRFTLDSYGFELSVLDALPRTPGDDRGREVRLWIQQKSGAGFDQGKSRFSGNFVVLDSIDRGYSREYPSRFVQVDPLTGLHTFDVERVERAFAQGVPS
jgi:hypothetical protein